ncbi:MAG: hypothetical protein JXB32_08035, partial [Deltaproteobacteria bacterium]|nr:hypothetical protein [Deltaproteobacteria bacterium]
MRWNTSGATVAAVVAFGLAASACISYGAGDPDAVEAGADDRSGSDVDVLPRDADVPPDGAADPPGEAARSAVPFDDDPAVDDAALRELSAGQLALAADLLELGPAGRNRVLSPVSISMAFAMLSAGVRGSSLTDLEGALHFPAQDHLHQAMAALLLRLRASEVPASADSDGVELRPVNQLFQERTFEVLPAYLDELAAHYDAGVRLVDFVYAADRVRTEINDWVEEWTRGRIADLLPGDSVTSSTTLVLVNALYLRAAWADAFPEYATSDETFHAASGDRSVPFLCHTTDRARFSRSADADVVELRFVGNLVFTVVVPRGGATVDVAGLAERFASLGTGSLTLHLPRFRTTTEIDLQEALGRLGFEVGACDLSGINAELPSQVSGAYHKAFVGLDE